MSPSGNARALRAMAAALRRQATELVARAAEIAPSRKPRSTQRAPHPKIESYTALSCNVLTVHAGTNCPQGGDSGHGGLTVLELVDVGGTDIEVTRTARGVRLQFGGDAECDTLLECLRFAVATLEDQTARTAAARKRRP